MLQAIKRMVGAERNDPATKAPTLDRAELEKPVTAAREQLRVAAAEHEASRARAAELAASLETAQTNFDADGSEASADLMASIERDQDRHALFIARTQRAVVTAEGWLAAAEKTRDLVILANLKDRINGAGERIAALWSAKGRGALTAFAAFVTEVDELITDARTANAELARIEKRDAYPGTRGIEALRSTVRACVERDLGAHLALQVGRLIGS